MKFRNEIILTVCFILGNIVASWPGEVMDYAERAEAQALSTASSVANHAPEQLLASAS